MARKCGGGEVLRSGGVHQKKRGLRQTSLFEAVGDGGITLALLVDVPLAAAEACSVTQGARTPPTDSAREREKGKGKNDEVKGTNIKLKEGTRSKMGK